MLSVLNITTMVAIITIATTYYVPQMDGQAELACVAGLNSKRVYALIVNHFRIRNNLHLMMLLTLGYLLLL